MSLFVGVVAESTWPKRMGEGRARKRDERLSSASLYIALSEIGNFSHSGLHARSSQNRAKADDPQSAISGDSSLQEYRSTTYYDLPEPIMRNLSGWILGATGGPEAPPDGGEVP